jgi:GT2 family glycosyltransferase
MTQLDDLHRRAAALTRRLDVVARDLADVAAAVGAPDATDSDPLPDLGLLDAEVARLERSVAIARRRQLVRTLPVRGRVALLHHVLARLRRAAPPPPVPPQEGAPHSGTAREREAAIGERLGRLIVLRTELDRAQQDLLVSYRRWIGRSLGARQARRRGARRGRVAASNSPLSPRVSVLTAVYNTPEQLLLQQLQSVAGQTFVDFEHILVDDGSPDDTVRRVLDRASAADRRRVVVHRAVNGGIVAASRDALQRARGEYIALVDHDDLLDPVALEQMVAALDSNPAAVLAYSDHDILTASGRPFDPFYKPDFSPERLRGQNYITHFVVARREAVNAVGGFRDGYDGAQDHDLVLRLGEVGPVVHVPGVLYHWRQAPDSVAADENAKPYAFDAGRRAVADHCARVGIDATVLHGSLRGTYTVRRRLSSTPLVSVVIPTRGSSGVVWDKVRHYVVDAVASIEANSTYPSVEYIVVADSVTPPAVLEELARVGGDKLRIVPFDERFNFSRKCNVGADAASGDVLLFLNDDTELIAPDSIGEFVGHLQSTDVGMVGARLLFADGRLQHGGHLYADGPIHSLFGWPGSAVGPQRMCAIPRECSGVTAAAAAMRREVFDAVGRFDEAFPVNFNDVDLCLRVRREGYRIVWTPAAHWYHFESVTRVAGHTQDELDLLLGRWREELNHDVYFNPCLLPGRNDWLPRPMLSGISADVLGGR